VALPGWQTMEQQTVSWVRARPSEGVCTKYNTLGGGAEGALCLAAAAGNDPLGYILTAECWLSGVRGVAGKHLPRRIDIGQSRGL